MLGCAALAAYYLVFVLGWIRILGEWGIKLSYPAALRAEMLSMLAKYIPGAIWAPAARVVAARRAGVTDAALVTSSMLLEAGLSAVAGVIVFVVSLPFVDNVDAPLWPLVTFGAVLAILVQPRVFRPLAGWVLRRVGYKKELPNMRGRTISELLVFYAGTWVLGGFALWLLLALGRRPSRAGDDRLSSAGRPWWARSSPSSSSSLRRGSGRARRRCTGSCSPSPRRARRSARSR